jgi:heme oxygenase (biliverdin-IX-beta and delta-forming)
MREALRMNAPESIKVTQQFVEVPVAERAIDRLRDETRVAHSRLDETLGLLDRLNSLDQRGRLLAGYHWLHRETEAKIAPFLGEISDLDFPARRRSSLLAQDLAVLGHPARLDHPIRLDIHTSGAAFGALYVLEGSTLGGRVILKELKLRGASLVGLGFLDPYGNRTGDRWRSFLAILEREIKSSDQKAEAVTGALNTFAFAEGCLRKESTN